MAVSATRDDGTYQELWDEVETLRQELTRKDAELKRVKRERDKLRGARG